MIIINIFKRTWYSQWNPKCKRELILSMFYKVALIPSLIIFAIDRNIASSKLIKLLLIRKDWTNTFILLFILSIFILIADLILVILINFHLPVDWQWSPMNFYLFFYYFSTFMFCLILRTCQFRVILCGT